MTPDDPKAAARWSLRNVEFSPKPLLEAANPTTPPERLAALFDENAVAEQMTRSSGERMQALLLNPNLPLDTLQSALCGVGNTRYWIHRVEWAWFNPSLPLLVMTRPDLFREGEDIPSMAKQALEKLSDLAGPRREGLRGRTLAGMVAYWAEYPRHGPITERNAHIRALAKRIAEVLSLPFHLTPLEEASDPQTSPERLGQMLSYALGPPLRETEDVKMACAILRNPNLSLFMLLVGLEGAGAHETRPARQEAAWFNPSMPLLAMTYPDGMTRLGGVSRASVVMLGAIAAEESGDETRRHQFQGATIELVVRCWAEEVERRNALQHMPRTHALLRRMTEVLSLPWPTR